MVSCAVVEGSKWRTAKGQKVQREFTFAVLLGLVVSLSKPYNVNGFSSPSTRYNPRQSFFRLHGKELSSSFVVPSNRNATSHKKRKSKPSRSQKETDAQQLFTISNEDPNDQRYSAQDWLHNMYTLPHSTVLRAVKGPVIAAMAWSFCVILLNTILTPQQSSRHFLSIPSPLPHAATVSALSLLLVFRTNTAYQRFNEGRLIWEHILGVARNFTRLLYLYPKEFSNERRQRMCRYIAAFPYLLKDHVVELPRGRIIPWIPPECALSSHRPLWMCDALASEIADVPYTDNYTSREREKLLGYVGQLSAATDRCERIHQTMVPVHYARHAVRALTVWLWTLPLLLLHLKVPVVWVVPTVGMVAWLLLGIYQIGFTIEDPFQGSLRLAALCDEIYRNIMTTQRASAFHVQE